VGSRKDCLAVLSEKNSSRRSTLRGGSTVLVTEWVADLGKTLTSWDKLEDIAAESELIGLMELSQEIVCRHLRRLT